MDMAYVCLNNVVAKVTLGCIFLNFIVFSVGLEGGNILLMFYFGC